MWQFLVAGVARWAQLCPYEVRTQLAYTSGDHSQALPNIPCLPSGASCRTVDDCQCEMCGIKCKEDVIPGVLTGWVYRHRTGPKMGTPCGNMCLTCDNQRKRMGWVGSSLSGFARLVTPHVINVSCLYVLFNLLDGRLPCLCSQSC